ncbi:hydantoinase B/oxoprolinase family protein [Kineobactrum salinum]|uniref:Hydantoinase B/oxoprolinase family protein n=1 Tax=Kineobactrum salinum TaxID=2708301 RepID=A0A6C0U7Q5_9GAMM|nr:hydantoinase B/oxoprolinase family protein [Kineobactrum salinum]QIB67017.1 hydantoinase B/oxoprolinase family protein [Kineobactrum salinum]
MNAIPGQNLDIVTAEIIRNRLIAGTNDMATTLVRTAFNPLLYEVQDYGVAIVSPEGLLWAECPACTIFSRTIPSVIRAAVEHRGISGFEPGDILIANDPYLTGTHISDTTVYMPVFHGDALVAFTAVTAHWADIGGKEPGGWCPDSVDVYQEGLCFTNQRLIHAGERNEDLWEMIRNNVRVPEMVTGDLQAQIAACRQGAERIGAVCARYGVGNLQAAMTRAIEATAAAMERELRRVDQGAWGASIALDSDGVNDEGEFIIALEVTIRQGRIHVSFDGTSTAARGPINIPEVGTRGAVATVIKGLLMPDDATNEGHAAQIDFTISPGLLVSPTRPQPVDSYGYAIECITECMFQALGPVFPERVPAGGFQLFGFSLSRADARDGKPFVMMDPMDGGNGAYPDCDGPTMMFVGNGDVPNNPVEITETRYPLRIERLELCADVMGAGRFNGGKGLIKDYRVLERGLSLMFASENVKDPTAKGLEGGLNGKPNSVTVDYGGSNEKTFYRRQNGIGPLAAGTIHRAISGGGGGRGRPETRDPDQVLRDVRNGFIDVRTARDVYRVAIADGRPPAVDIEQTRALRAD